MGGTDISKLRPRVLMLLLEYHPVFTGHGIYLEQLIFKLKQMDCEISILAADFGELLPVEQVHGIDVFRFPYSPGEKKWEIKLAIRVIWFLLRHRSDYDILHIHGHLDIYGLLTLYNKLVRKHTISQMVLLGADDPMALKKTYKCMSLRLKVLSMMDQFLCISQALRESCLQANILPAKITYIPQGVDVDRFSPVATNEKKEELRTKLELPNGVDVVMFVGAVVERKGVDWLVTAWKEVQKIYPDACLVLVGQHQFDKLDVNQVGLNSFVTKIVNIIDSNNMNVKMVGGRNNVEEYLQCADVFVLPSRKEGFGNVILEAMSCGIPSVITYMDGVSGETITHNENGFIANSVDEISKWISKLLADKELAIRLGNNGRLRALENFSLNDIAKRYLSVYRNIIAS